MSLAASTVRGPSRKSLIAAFVPNAESTVEIACSAPAISGSGTMNRGISGRRARVATAR